MIRIPTKIVIEGDLVEGRRLVGYAKSQMAILENQMSFQKLKQGHRKLNDPASGVVIECTACYGHLDIYIYVPPPGGEERKTRKYCRCYPCYSLGVIESVTPETVTTTWLESGARFVHSVSVCSVDQYVIYENIPAAGAEKYNVGQNVMVAGQRPAEFADIDCLTGWAEEDLTLLFISPLFDESGMELWRVETI